MCRLTKGKIWMFWVSKLLVYCQKWVAHIHQLALWSRSPGRKVFDCVIYNKICCSLSNLTQKLCLSQTLEEAKATLILYYIFFVSCEEIDCYHDFAIGEVAFGSSSILWTQPAYAMASSKSFFQRFFLFLSREVWQNSLFPDRPVMKCLIIPVPFFKCHTPLPSYVLEILVCSQISLKKFVFWDSLTPPLKITIITLFLLGESVLLFYGTTQY